MSIDNQLNLSQKLAEIIQQPELITQLSITKLSAYLQLANESYRAGNAIITDAEYDFVLMAELIKRDPNNPLISRLEPEAGVTGKTIALPEIMLSTEKVYTYVEIERWLQRIKKAAHNLNINFNKLTFKVTPKLDGYAAFDDGHILYTRGDGNKGTDISRVFKRGLQVATGGERGLGAGEIVVSKSYFKQHLASVFDNSRNFQASVIKEKTLSLEAKQAITTGAAVFFPFALLPNWCGNATELLADFEAIIQQIWHKIDYDVDGVVLEVTEPTIKQHMGATRHHHRWQIAYKENLATAVVKILAVTPQTSRSGRVTPVAELEPVRLSGALLQRATAHHYKMVLEQGIGAGAEILLARSGEVIPKIEQVLTSVTAEIPTNCPSCEDELYWEGDFLKCPNTLACPAQISQSIEYFFRVLANNDGFGAATIAKLYAHNVRDLATIYALTQIELIEFGFGAKQAENLIAELTRSRTEIIADWRFLAAFGVIRLGQGNCEKLLSHHALETVFALKVTEIVAIDGFANTSATAIIQGLRLIKPVFDKIYALGFKLQITPTITASQSEHNLAGKTLVFTGAMQQGTRAEMQQQARALGAKVATAVSGNTDYLVIGNNVGAKKLQAATTKGVTIISEAEYLNLLKV